MKRVFQFVLTMGTYGAESGSDLELMSQLERMMISSRTFRKLFTDAFKDDLDFGQDKMGLDMPPIYDYFI